MGRRQGVRLHATAASSSPTSRSAQLIKGWEQGLVGKKVGSRVMLVDPARPGVRQPGAAAGIPANATLVFTVDILAAI